MAKMRVISSASFLNLVGSITKCRSGANQQTLKFHCYVRMPSISQKGRVLVPPCLGFMHWFKSTEEVVELPFVRFIHGIGECKAVNVHGGLSSPPRKIQAGLGATSRNSCVDERWIIFYIISLYIQIAMILVMIMIYHNLLHCLYKWFWLFKLSWLSYGCFQK